MSSDDRCPTCGLTNEDDLSVYCSNCWHLTGEDRIPGAVGVGEP